MRGARRYIYIYDRKVPATASENMTTETNLFYNGISQQAEQASSKSGPLSCFGFPDTRQQINLKGWERENHLRASSQL